VEKLRILHKEQENDALLKRKIAELPDTTPYKRIVDQYFESALNHGASTQQRVREITKALRALWVVKAGKSETFTIFEDFATFEGFLFQSPDYRGHYAHQFNVFLLGYYILNKITQNDEGCRSVFFRGSSNPNFTWMLSSTFHDMGYPIQQLDDWFSKFLNMFLKVDVQYQIEVEKVLTPLFFEYARYLSKEHAKQISGYSVSLPSEFEIDWKFYNVLLTRLRKKDHGIISALLLMHSLLTQEEIKKFSGEGLEWIRQTFPHEIMPACHAISIHHLVQEIQTEDFRNNLRHHPYAFLLILCDVLQDWGRSISQKDYSELVDINIDCSHHRPVISCNLQVNNKRKLEELDMLENKLSNNLLEVVIKQESGDRIWKI